MLGFLGLGHVYALNSRERQGLFVDAEVVEVEGIRGGIAI